MARVLRRGCGARALVRGTRRAVALAAPRARPPAEPAPRAARGAPRALRRDRLRSLRRRVRRRARRGALGRDEHRADVHLGALLARARPADDPVRQRLGVGEPLARGRRRRRVAVGEVGAHAGSRRSRTPSGSAAGRPPRSSSRSPRWSSRTRTRRTRACSRSRSRSTAGSPGSGWRRSGATRGSRTARRSPSTSACSRASRSRRFARAAGRCAGRSTASRGTSSSPGTVAFVAVMLGSVAFDGFSRTSFWQDRLFRIDSQAGAIAFSLAGLAVAVGDRRRRVRARGGDRPADRRQGLPPRAGVHRQPDPDRARVRGRALPHAAADPGAARDPARVRPVRATAGTSSARSTSASNVQPLSADQIWYAQAGALVIGHVARADDRPRQGARRSSGRRRSRCGRSTRCLG